jgi:uncharacterized protein
MDDKTRAFLLQTARETISSKLGGSRSNENPEKEDIPEEADRNGACFVTLTKNGELRGCIGSLEARRSLIEDVRANAYNSAFRDPRFPPVRKDELKNISIEISILSERTKVEYSDLEDLKNKIIPGIHGVYLTYGYNSATFLPQVWEQLPEFDYFFSHLCQKAGLRSDIMSKEKVSIETYTVENFQE